MVGGGSLSRRIALQTYRALHDAAVRGLCILAGVKKRATTHRTSPSLITQRASVEPLSQSLNVYFVNTVREHVESDELLS